MNRLLGYNTKKKVTTEQAVNSATDSIRPRIDSAEVEIQRIKGEVKELLGKIANMRDGPGKTRMRKQALTLLQRQRTKEASRDQLQSQMDFLLDTKSMSENVEATSAMLDAMNTTTKALKKQHKAFNPDKIDKILDEAREAREMNQELQEAFSAGFEVPELLDEEDLDAELEALQEEVAYEGQYGASETPSYLLDDAAPPQFIDEAPEQSKVKEAAG